MDEFDALQGLMDGVEFFEADHLVCLSLRWSMALLEVVETLALPNFVRSAVFFVVGYERRGVEFVLVAADFLMGPIASDCLTRESDRRFRIALGGQQELEGVAFFDEGTSEEEDEPAVFLSGMAFRVAGGLVLLPLAVLART